MARKITFVKSVIKAAERMVSDAFRLVLAVLEETENVLAVCSFVSLKAKNLKVEGNIIMAELREGQEITVKANFKTAAGHAAAYQKGSAKWSSSDESIATVEASSDNELEGVVKGVDGSENKSAVITLEADGDPDAEDVQDIVGTLAVTVTQGNATVVDLTASTPRAIPASTGGSTSGNATDANAGTAGGASGTAGDANAPAAGGSTSADTTGTGGGAVDNSGTPA